MVDRITPWLRLLSYICLLVSIPIYASSCQALKMDLEVTVSLCDPPPNVATLSNSLSAFHHFLSVLLAY